MPRAGSALVEQILASHSAIRNQRSCRISCCWPAPRSPCRACVQTIREYWRSSIGLPGRDHETCCRRRIPKTRPPILHRQMSNYLHIGMIQLILPNAKIIDVHGAMCSSFSPISQHFARAQTYSYRLADLGRSYRDYVDLMRHFEERYCQARCIACSQNLVADPESEIRRLLDYLAPSKRHAFNSHQNSRVCHHRQFRTGTAANFQGRAGVVSLRRMAGPAQNTLGPVLDAYRARRPIE